MNNMLDHLDDKGLENIIRQAQMDNYHHEVVIAQNLRLSAMARMRRIQKELDNGEVE